MRFAIVLALLLTLNSSSYAGGRMLGKAGVAQSSPGTPAQSELQSLRNDLQRMKVLVQQMESNLAFVDTTQSPLKHQFQLEIDMWKTVMGEMERKINATNGH
jgi:hypothetical protein